MSDERKCQCGYPSPDDRSDAHATQHVTWLKSTTPRESEQRCPNCAPGYDCESGVYTPKNGGTR